MLMVVMPVEVVVTATLLASGVCDIIVVGADHARSYVPWCLWPYVGLGRKDSLCLYQVSTLVNLMQFCVVEIIFHTKCDTGTAFRAEALFSVYSSYGEIYSPIYHLLLRWTRWGTLTLNEENLEML